jgi:hypothetical protein
VSEALFGQDPGALGGPITGYSSRVPNASQSVLRCSCSGCSFASGGSLTTGPPPNHKDNLESRGKVQQTGRIP